METRRSPKNSRQEPQQQRIDESAVESWLEEHEQFFEDYFLRRANQRLIDKWLYRRTAQADDANDDSDAAAAAAGEVSLSPLDSACAMRKISNELSFLDRNQPPSPLLNKLDDGSSTFIVDFASTPASSPTATAAPTAGAALSESEMINELAKDIFHELDVTVLCHKILRNVCILIGADRCSLFLVERSPGGGKQLVSSLFDVTAASSLTEALASHSTIRIPIGQGIVGNVALSGQPIRIEDAYSDSRFNCEVDRRTGYRTRSVLCMPVMDHRGEVVGVTQAVNKLSTDCSSFTVKDEKTFERFLTFCGIGIRNAKLYLQSQLETKRNQVLLDLVRIIFEQQTDLQPLVANILHYMQVITGCCWCQILLVDDPCSQATDNRATEMKKYQCCETGLFDQVFELFTEGAADQGERHKMPVTRDCRLLLNSNITRLVYKSGEPLHIPNASQDERLTELERTKLTSLLCLPIKNSKFRVVGLCLLMNKRNGEMFSQGDQQLAEAFALFCGLGIHSTRMHERAEVAMKRQKVALDVLSYHAVATQKDAASLSKCLVPSARYLRIADFAFSDIGMNDEETLICVIKMFEDTGVFSKFKIDYCTFCRWLLSVKKNYRKVTYHNWRHALNVTQTMFAMLKASPELRSNMSQINKLALLIACLCHDLDHRGTDNKFQQLALSPLAQLYSSSMLERHHFNQCIMLLSIGGCDILSPLSQPQYEHCIAEIEKSIIATDLQRHFESRKQLTQIMDNEDFNWSQPSHMDLLHGLLMTAADLSAIAKPWSVQFKTAHLVANEFYEQGDRERSEFNVQPEAVKDRENRQNLPSMQVGFIDFVCQPVYTMLSKICTNLDALRDGCSSNRQQWAALATESAAS